MSYMFNFRIAFPVSMVLLFLLVCVAVFTNLDEDAFISFRYVDQLYEGNGLVFNTGERVEGYSNILWIILVFFFKILGFSLVNTARILGILFALGTSIVGMGSIKKLIPEDAQLSWLFGLWYLLSIPIIFWSQGGLETSLIAFVIMCFIYYQTLTKKGWFWAGVWVVLGSLTRPEAHMLILLYCIILLCRYQKRECIVGITFVSGFLLMYHLLRIIHFGEFLPTPAMIKLSGDFTSGVDYLMSFFVGGHYLWALPFFLYAIINKSVRKLILVPAGVVILYILFNLYVGGDYKYHFRFIVPFIAPFMLVSIVGVCQIKTLFPHRFGKTTVRGVVVLLIILPLFFYHSTYGDKRSSFAILREGFSDWENRFTGQLKTHMQNYNMCYNVFLGKWIHDNFSPRISIAYEQMGQVPYYAGTEYSFIDLLGLTNLYIASCYKRLHPSSIGRFIKEAYQIVPLIDTKNITEKISTIFCQGDPSANQDIARYVLERRPEVIMVVAFISRWHPWIDLFNSQSFRDNYRLAQVFGYRQGVVWQGIDFEENNTIIFFRKDHYNTFQKFPRCSFIALPHDWFRHYSEPKEVVEWIKRKYPELLPLLYTTTF